MRLLWLCPLWMCPLALLGCAAGKGKQTRNLLSVKGSL